MARKLTKTQAKKLTKRALDAIGKLMTDRLMQPDSVVPITMDTFKKARQPLKMAFNKL